MFRKDRKMVKAWEEHGPEFFVKIQRSIITQAAQMLKPGGMLTLFYMYFFHLKKMNRRLNFCYKNTLNLRFVISKDTKGFQMGF